MHKKILTGLILCALGLFAPGAHCDEEKELLVRKEAAKYDTTLIIILTGCMVVLIVGSGVYLLMRSRKRKRP
jgi:hypothetical protein